MAAKKKNTPKKKGSKKKASKKKVSNKAKPATKKKMAKKSAKKSKRPVKKKVVNKSPLLKKAAKRTKPVNKRVIKKITPKKKVAAPPKQIVTLPPPAKPVIPVTRGSGGSTVREAPMITILAMNIEARFELGRGTITAKQFRAGNPIDEDTIDLSDNINFLDVRARDVITINGVCSGSARITTDRNTIRPSDEAHPLEFDHEDIFVNLIVL